MVEMIKLNKEKLGKSGGPAKRPSVASQQDDGSFDIVAAIKNRGALRKTSTSLSLESMCSVHVAKQPIQVFHIKYNYDLFVAVPKDGDDSAPVNELQKQLAKRKESVSSMLISKHH